MGADDFEIDHVREVLRSPETAKLFHMGDEGKTLSADQEEFELEIQLEALKLWVQRRIERREAATRSARSDKTVTPKPRPRGE